MNEIVKKIIEDAEATAAKMISDAEAAVSERVEAARKELEKNKTATIERTKTRLKQEEAQKANLVKTQERKEQLAARQNAITQVFDIVRKELAGASATQLQKLVEALITKFGKDGDTVIIAKADDKKLPESFFKSLKVKNLKRELSGKIDSGIILENPRTETRLTLNEILETLRDKTELEVSRMIVG